jgi:hypothetical protein
MLQSYTRLFSWFSPVQDNVENPRGKSNGQWPQRAVIRGGDHMTGPQASRRLPDWRNILRI